jgi:tetratricopeptide (TPR) repeat protein
VRYKAEHIPTLANRLALAERLVEKKGFDEAIPPLETALKTEPDHGQILYLLALCHARLGRPAGALPLLEKLLARDPRWSNYVAWHLLIETHGAKGDGAGALKACRELLRLAPTLEHHCLLAEHLIQEGQADEARGLLDRSLRDHSFAPGAIRRRNRRWAGEARRLQKIAGGQ